MRLVIIESPFAGDIEKNLRYLRACMRDSLLRGEAPYASHAMYTQPGVLDDGDPVDRDHGINAGFAWRRQAEATVVYTDLGVSRGMEYGIAAAKRLREEYLIYADSDPDQWHPLEFRELGPDWEPLAIEHEKTFKTKWP
jgi:hypothetical protein